MFYLIEGNVLFNDALNTFVLFNDACSTHFSYGFEISGDEYNLNDASPPGQ